MEANIIQIGNSKGIIIPKSFLKTLSSNKVELVKQDNQTIIKAIPGDRSGWEEAAMKAVSENDAKQIFPDFFDDETDTEEWTW